MALDNAYNDDVDEDEFGLPTLSTMRRKAKRIPNEKSYDPGGGVSNVTLGSSLLQPVTSGRGRSNSSDIAEERGPPSYPTTKKSEGKILRPQYKDILRGAYIQLWLKAMIDSILRSCKFPSSNQPPSTADTCNGQRSRSAFDSYL